MTYPFSFNPVIINQANVIWPRKKIVHIFCKHCCNTSTDEGDKHHVPVVYRVPCVVWNSEELVGDNETRVHLVHMVHMAIMSVWTEAVCHVKFASTPELRIKHQLLRARIQYLIHLVTCFHKHIRDYIQ